jgi:hypothetical protein
MTYEEAIALCPHNQTFVQVDDLVRVMTPKEYEAYIQQLVDSE